VKGWSWQSYWLIQAAVCWFILPVVVAWLTIPELGAVLREAPRSAMVLSFALGMAYGIGGTAFGISIRHIGFSLTYAIAIGLSTVLGTLIPPLVKGTLGAILAKPGSAWVVAGIGIGIIGIAMTGAAGRMKERGAGGGVKPQGFSLVTGLLLSLLAGVLSAVYGFSLEAGDPVADVAASHGAGVFRGNVVYLFANSGALVTTLIYCLYLHLKHGTMGEVLELPAGPERSKLPVNWAMAVLTGFLWYGQFFFYNLGHVRMGTYKFASWAIHMIMLILFSILVGTILREWSGTGRLTRLTLAAAFLVLLGAVVTLTYGNHLGEVVAGH
jgi:L-rhamnose-H+ transport protein